MDILSPDESPPRRCLQRVFCSPILYNACCFVFMLTTYLVIAVLTPADHRWFMFGTIVAFIGLVLVPMCFFCCSGSRRLERRRREFWVKRFDRVFIGLPFAIFTIWELSHASYWISRSAEIQEEAKFRVEQILLVVAASISILQVGFGALEIDRCTFNSVHRRLQLSRLYKVEHLLFRAAETTNHITILIVLTLATERLVEELQGSADRYDVFGIPTITCLSSLFITYFLWFIATGALFLTNCCAKQTSPERLAACFVVGYAAVAFNPMCFLHHSAYCRYAKRANVFFFVYWYLQQILVGIAMAVVAYYWPIHAFTSWRDYPIEEQAASGVFLAVLFALSTLVFHTILLLDRRFRQLLRPDAARVHLLPYRSAGLAQVQTLPQVGLSQFILDLCGTGLITATLPLKPVCTEDIVVEEILGAGSFGVVVRVRRERKRNGRLLPRGLQKRFALKLHTMESPPGATCSSVGKTQHKLAMREREVYQRIWQEPDEVTGRVGHPFIVELVCASDWPDGRQLFYEDCGKPVEFRNRKIFHCALMMEYCPLGSLSNFLPTHMRRGVDDQKTWLQVSRRFAAEIVLALDFLHNCKHVIYRDLKPDNVLIVNDCSGTFHIKLSDFGCSKIVTTMSPPTSLVGSPYFAAPELAQGRLEHGTDWSLDAFSFGMILLVMVHGCNLYRRHDNLQWVPDALLAGVSSGEDCQWLAPDKVAHPHPHIGHARHSWEYDLRRLENEPQCPRHVIQVIKDCTMVCTNERPTVSQLKCSDLFGQQNDMPAIDWARLDHIDARSPPSSMSKDRRNDLQGSPKIG